MNKPIPTVKSLNPFKSVLLIIYDIIKAHGGELNVQTKQCKGSTLLISIPLRRNP
tara:strand:+ start:550 stop:714 length:165 start_codon:yes stop_codon:yes gene_type:complete